MEPTRAHAYEVPEGTFAWTRHGAVAGILGAATIAVYFFVLDWLRGHVLWTPHALGSALFLGEAAPVDASPDAAIVLGYTAIHGALFVATGLLAAAELFLQRRLPVSPIGGTVLTVLFFAAYEAVFLTFAAVFNPALVDNLGGGYVAGANLLAALLMSVYLVGAARRRAASGRFAPS
jgi:hypothetical protein